MGAMYGATLFLGINNCSTVQPMVSIERSVFYRERGAGMYSAMPYAIAQVRVRIYAKPIIKCRETGDSLYIYYIYLL
jgi:hypothetical protein